MDEKEIMSYYDNEEEAQNVLQASRKRIDEIDNDLVNLISERTSLAKDIVSAKVFLGMEIYDKSREELDALFQEREELEKQIKKASAKKKTKLKDE